MAGPRPNRIPTGSLKSRILNLAQTSVYRVKIQPPVAVDNFLQRVGREFNYNTSGGNLELLCSETSLPGSTLATHDQTSNYAGVTEKFAYRRLYDETLNMSFYVDKTYNVIEFFEGWMDFISGVGRNGVRNDYKDTPIGYRMSYPKDYKTNIFVTKFEKDVENKQLSYTFVDAFPITINSSPVSYNQSEILKYSVSFSYVRYVRERFKATTIQSDFDAGATILGIVNLGDGRYRVDRLVGGQVVSTIESSIPEGSVGIGL